MEEVNQSISQLVDQVEEGEVIDAPGAPPQQPVQYRVIVHGDRVGINFSFPVDLVGFSAYDALVMARELRTKANQVLHEEHVAAMQSKRRAKQAHKAAAHGRRS